MKFEYKKHAKELYGTNAKAPAILTVPAQKFIMIKGKGDPNQADFSERVGVLYSIAYSIKMRFKNFCKQHETDGKQYPYQDYAIFPLEGVWTSESSDPTEKDKFIYTIMIRQPDFITQEMFDAAVAEVKRKKPHPFIEEIAFEEMRDGLVVQLLHVGTFDNEPDTFARMDRFIAEAGYVRTSTNHREIYLNDARKTLPERRKTLLRYEIQAGEAK